MSLCHAERNLNQRNKGGESCLTIQIVQYFKYIYKPIFSDALNLKIEFQFANIS